MEREYIELKRHLINLKLDVLAKPMDHLDRGQLVSEARLLAEYEQQAKKGT
ncbi:MAG: hypothetical protein IT169_06755 [Bryobacterales bacterium]|nr:hypothetical protein [Bryobacterales bacterium]